MLAQTSLCSVPRGSLNPSALGSASQPCWPRSYFLLPLSLTKPVWTLSLSCTKLTPICTLPPSPLFLATQPPQTPQTPALVGGGWGFTFPTWDSCHLLVLIVQISPWHTPISKELALTHVPDQREKKKKKKCELAVVCLGISGVSDLEAKSPVGPAMTPWSSVKQTVAHTRFCPGLPGVGTGLSVHCQSC